MKSIKQMATAGNQHAHRDSLGKQLQAPSQVKLIEEALMKFSDLLIASSSLAHDEICFWEPKTLAPYDPLTDKKFYCQPNTLQVNSANYVISANSTKTTVNVWRFDKKEAVARFPVKELLSCLRLTHNAGTICIAGSKTGRLSIWEFSTGELLGEIESCHYLEVTALDIAVTNDLVITGGKDFKVRVWVLTDLYFGQKNTPFAEFAEHTSDVTAVQFSKSSPQRAFSASLDKTFKVYDVAARCTLKSIQATSPINHIAIDNTETMVYLACDN